MIRSLLVFALLGAPTLASAQDLSLPVLSPQASVSQQVGTVTVTVDYSSPGKRGREVFGTVVPWGELWRSGANGATTLTVDGDVSVGGKALSAGTYSLFTVPGEDGWKVMLNSDATASTGRYDAKNDVVSIDVKATKGADRERLTYLFEDTTAEGTTLVLNWAGVRVPVDITVDTKARGNADIDRFVAGSARAFVQAARFKSENGEHDAAVELATHATNVQRSWYTVWALADVKHGAGENKEAYKLAKEAKELGDASDNFFYGDRVEKALAEWPKK